MSQHTLFRRSCPTRPTSLTTGGFFPGQARFTIHRCLILYLLSHELDHICKTTCLSRATSIVTYTTSNIKHASHKSKAHSCIAITGLRCNPRPDRISALAQGTSQNVMSPQECGLLVVCRSPGHGVTVIASSPQGRTCMSNYSIRNKHTIVIMCHFNETRPSISPNCKG
jgi:hypothetical protein